MTSTASSRRTILRGGTVIDGAGSQPRVADLAMRGDRIEAVGTIAKEHNDEDIDVSGRYLLPGFIDAHSHAEATVFSADVQRALLRQGVTTIITGQDGVSFAPGDGSFATEYFGALNGRHPTYRGGGVAELLRSYDATTPINVGYLIPAGTVRHQIMGYAMEPPTPIELFAMNEIISTGLKEGALGLSSGLDYVPNIYAATSELAELCRSVAAAGAIYVTHMRGGYESNSRIGIDEVREIALTTGVSVHVSHLHGPSDLLIDLINEMTTSGIDASFDAYPYRRGCSLLAMPILPVTLLAGSPAQVIEKLSDETVRMDLFSNWFPTFDDNPLLGPTWAESLTLAHIAAPEYSWAHGLTLQRAADSVKQAPEELAVDLLVASSLEVSVIMAVRKQRQYRDFARIVTHSAHIAGSDGIFVGNNTHPRAWGTFAKFLRLVTRERGDFTWADAALHLSGHAAQRFGLADRGRLWPGYAADVAIVDPILVSDVASYETPRADAIGIDAVFVGGRKVLEDGQLTGVNSGRGLRRSTPVR